MLILFSYIFHLNLEEYWENENMKIIKDQDINTTDVSEKFEISELALQTPIGWSSICLDQAINYYIDCNSVNINRNEILNTINCEEL